MIFNNIEVRLTKQASMYLDYLRANGLNLSDEKVLELLTSKPIEFGDNALHIALLQNAMSDKLKDKWEDKK